MFTNLSNKLSNVFDVIQGKKIITEDDIDAALRQIRIALLEADVSLVVIKRIVDSLKIKLVGLKMSSGSQVAPTIIRELKEGLIQILGGTEEELTFPKHKLSKIIVFGLQGSGKTTTCAKLALLLKKSGHRVLLVSTDQFRPAAKHQLQILCEQNELGFFEPCLQSGNSIQTIRDAEKYAVDTGYNILLIDTAGRSYIEEEMMVDLKSQKDVLKPDYSILVVDSLTGQDTINIVQNFDSRLNIDGIILTRVDGDLRGGSALSIKAVTGKPIKYFCSGEKVTEIEVFNPERISSRILDLGDFVSLKETAEKAIEEKEVKNLSYKLQTGKFDLNDLLQQIESLKKMGGLNKILGFVPGASKIRNKLDSINFDPKQIERQAAIIKSMSAQERRDPKILFSNTSRKRRIAAGSGSTILDVNRILKRYEEMMKMLSKIQKGKGRAQLTKNASALLEENSSFFN